MQQPQPVKPRLSIYAWWRATGGAGCHKGTRVPPWQRQPLKAVSCIWELPEVYAGNGPYVGTSHEPPVHVWRERRGTRLLTLSLRITRSLILILPFRCMVRRTPIGSMTMPSLWWLNAFPLCKRRLITWFSIHWISVTMMCWTECRFELISSKIPRSNLSFQIISN